MVASPAVAAGAEGGSNAQEEATAAASNVCCVWAVGPCRWCVRCARRGLSTGRGPRAVLRAGHPLDRTTRRRRLRALVGPCRRSARSGQGPRCHNASPKSPSTPVPPPQQVTVVEGILNEASGAQQPSVALTFHSQTEHTHTAVNAGAGAPPVWHETFKFPVPDTWENPPLHLQLLDIAGGAPRSLGQLELGTDQLVSGRDRDEWLKFVPPGGTPDKAHKVPAPRCCRRAVVTPQKPPNPRHVPNMQRAVV